MKTLLPISATPWSLNAPRESGQFLVEYTGEFFPPGNINNIVHIIVHVVLHDGNLKLLMNGEFFPMDHGKDWKWARIIPYSP